MRTISLCAGKGDGKKTACLMHAISIITGHKHEGDHPSCVCEAIIHFGIDLNDSLLQVHRDELLVPLIWELPGTILPEASIKQFHEREKLLVSTKHEMFIAVCNILAHHKFNHPWKNSIRYDIRKPIACEAALVHMFLKQEYIFTRIRRIPDLLWSSANELTKLTLDAPPVDPDLRQEAEQAVDACLFEISLAQATIGVEGIRKAAAIGDKRPVEKALSPEQLAEYLA